MPTISLRLPDSLHNRISATSEKDNSSINLFIVTAIAEKLASLETEAYLSERASRGDQSKFRAVLEKVRDIAPEPYDAFADSPSPESPRPRHRWSREDEVVGYYLWRFGESNLPIPKEQIGELLGMGWNSLGLKIANFRSLDGQRGCDGFSKQAQQVYQEVSSLPESVLKERVLNHLRAAVERQMIQLQQQLGLPHEPE